MKNNFPWAIFFLLLFCICSCNDSNTDKTTHIESQQSPEVKSIFINGDSIHYVDAGKGKPVVFIHGALGDYRTFSKQMDDFTKNHRVISYSRRFAYPNKQTISDSSLLSVTAHAKDLAGFLKGLNIGKAVLVGHSYGADIALLVALDHPDLVNSLVLGEPFIGSLMQNVPGGDTVLNNFFAKAFTPVIDAVKNNNDEQVVAALATGVMGDSLYYSRLPQKDRDIMMANTLEVKGILSAKDAFPPVTCEDVKKITAPVLLLKGDKSPMIFSLMINELNRCLSNREIATMTNTSHGLEYENPEEFNRIVLAFLDKH